MKNLKRIFSVLTLSLLMFSCNEENETSSTQEIKRVENITLHGKGGQNARGGDVNGTIEFTFDENSEVVTDISMSPNLSNYLDLTDDQLEQMVQTEVQATEEGEDKHDHAACISNCNTQYTNADGTKKPGRGACKFNCWVSTTVQIVKAVATIAAST